MEKQGSPESDDKARIDGILTVLKIVSICAVVVAVGSVVCGVLVLVYTDPIWKFPYSTGSGIWSGFNILMMGCMGLNIARSYDHSTPCKWVYPFLAFAHIVTSTCGMHFGWSISGLTSCLSESSKCNPDERDNLIILSASGIFFGAASLLLAMFSLIYLYRGGRGAALTKNPRFGKWCCC